MQVSFGQWGFVTQFTCCELLSANEVYPLSSSALSEQNGNLSLICHNAKVKSCEQIQGANTLAATEDGLCHGGYHHLHKPSLVMKLEHLDTQKSQ